MTRQTINISEVHRLTGVDRQTIGKMLKHLTPIAEGKKNAVEYHIDEVLAAMVRGLKGKTEGTSKSRKEAADAEKAEINVQRLKAELAPTGLMRTAAADLVKSLFQRCVMLAPRIIADKITGNTDRAEVEIAIREHFAAIFDELRSLPNEFLKLDITTDADPTTDRQSEDT